MIESTGNYNYGTDDFNTHFEGMKAQPAQLLPLAEAETYVSIPLSQYARYIKREPIANRMAQLIADRWIESAASPWKIDDMKEELVCLRFYDYDLYASTERRVNEILAEQEAERKASVEEMLGQIREDATK